MHGVADLLTVGGTASLAPGLWQGTGKAQGRVKLPVAIGINGTGVNEPGSPSDSDGAQVITGQFMGDGFQDVIVYYPSGLNAGGGMAIYGSGDGSALITASDNTEQLPQGFLADANGDNPLDCDPGRCRHGVPGVQAVPDLLRCYPGAALAEPVGELAFQSR